jgi:hypothetical protein
MADTSIPDAPLTTLLESLDAANASARAPTEPRAAGPQPVHTVYGGAHLFRADTARKLGAVALDALNAYAPDARSLAETMGLDEAIASRVHPRLVAKLQREPVEDYRIDFEDGFGHRTDAEEDAAAQAAADQVAAGLAAGTLPRGLGIRIKPLSEESKRRSLRTFDRFLTRVVERTGGSLPPHVVVVLPKITSPGQVAALASACDAFEYWRELPAGSIGIEIMVETPQALIAPDGRTALPVLVEHGRGRVVGAHLGPYDFTASCDITAAYQDIRHPLCDFARQLMLVSLAATPVRVADGPTTVLPIAPHRAPPGARVSAAEHRENAALVSRAWRLHVGHVKHALANGFYQGWDLHPVQLPARFAAVYAFFLDGLEPAAERLRHFVDRAGQATALGDVFDDAATGQGLLNFFSRAITCGAIDEQDGTAMTGLSAEELHGRSFIDIVTARRSG